MNIAVCVKQIPDPAVPGKLDADNTLDREAADAVVNELDEYAIEEALQILDVDGMSPREAMDALYRLKGLMG